MAKEFINKVIVIPKNEEGNPQAHLRLETDTERELVFVKKVSWENTPVHQQSRSNEIDTVCFPVQFLPDVLLGLEKLSSFLASSNDQT